MSYSHNSMMHNASVLRQCLNVWADSNIDLGNAASWNAAAVNGHFPLSVRDANLWIDSVDAREDSWESEQYSLTLERHGTVCRNKLDMLFRIVVAVRL